MDLPLPQDGDLEDVLPIEGRGGHNQEAEAGKGSDTHGVVGKGKGKMEEREAKGSFYTAESGLKTQGEMRPDEEQVQGGSCAVWRS